ncbi:MAG: GH116 family glycosyl hydrolase, partial [Flavitalea sp.]
SKKINAPRSALSVKLKLAPGETKEIQFLLTWHFPNRKDWFDKETIGNYYATLYENAWDVAEKTIPLLASLEKKTLDFVKTFINSDYPDIVKEAALFNSSTLRSQTTFRGKDGNFFGWEGSFNTTGSCWGNCSHVWNYEFASPYLFGELAKSMRDIEYQYGLWDDSTGFMSFRVGLPLKKNNGSKLAAADGQMGTIMKVYREWQLSGDDDFLKRTWPGVKKALSFAWIPGGWDADKDGVMEGCQHNTMDIEYYGPNPEIEFWYLGALKASAAMAAYLKDKDFEKTCRKLFDYGSKWTDDNLFNGEFYIQKIQPIPDKNKIAARLRSGMGSADLVNPDFQIGEGCLVDQLVGQNMATICGLGYLAKPENIRKTHAAIAKYNNVKSFGDHFNNMRSYALGDESGLKLIAYPDPTKSPAIPVSYASEVWTGLEYTAATGMIYEGLLDEGVKVITAVRNRYSGSRRNPFNEEECGNHYVRAMASWSSILAISNFNYSAVTEKFSITSKPGNYFWSNGYSWGNASVSQNKLTITVLHSRLKLKSAEFKNGGLAKLKTGITLNEGESFTFTFTQK